MLLFLFFTVMIVFINLLIFKLNIKLFITQCVLWPIGGARALSHITTKLQFDFVQVGKIKRVEAADSSSETLLLSSTFSLSFKSVTSYSLVSEANPHRKSPK